MPKVNEEQPSAVPRVETKPTPELGADRDKDVSPIDIEEFKRKLACNTFVIDPHSRFCETCGYLRFEHQRT